MAAALINGIAFDYTQITPLFLGVPLVSMTVINYETTQEKTNNFGTGNLPVSRGRAAKDSNGSIELSMSDIEAMREVAPNGDILDIPSSDFVLVFGNPQNVQTHVLKNLEFTNDGGAATQGDTDLKFTLNFVISHFLPR